MKNYRTYSPRPYGIAVVHGGPGGPGQVAPIAMALSDTCGVLEPLQTKDSLEDQVDELQSTLRKHCQLPIILIGHSWGAMLSILCASRFPDLVKKLILIACGPLKAGYTSNDVMSKRLERMSDKDKTAFNGILKALENEKDGEKNQHFAQLGELAMQTDSYDLASRGDNLIEAQYNIFKKVWNEVELFRSKKGFEDAVRKIKCPVIAFHGDFDPHPAQGITSLLSSALRDFKFIQIEKCGHYPWLEKYAKDRFLFLLRRECEI